jgi:hypothetical protein
VLASTQLYVKGILDGLALPAAVPGPLVARITPPVAEKMKAPRAYVWGGRLRAGRQTAPRGTGMKKFPWIVDVYLSYMDTPDDALKNEPFPRVIDTVLTAFMTTVMPVWIDANGVPVGPNAASGTDTQIQAIGETFSLDYPPERTVTSLRQMWYTTLISMDVLEVIQA